MLTFYFNELKKKTHFYLVFFVKFKYRELVPGVVYQYRLMSTYGDLDS